MSVNPPPMRLPGLPNTNADRQARREATDPVFASQKAEERLHAAHDKYTRAVIDLGEGSEEASSALGDLIQAQRDVERANSELAASFSEETVSTLRAWAKREDVNLDLLNRWINLQREMAGLPPLKPPA